MLEDPKHSHAIRWADNTGTTVEVHRKNILQVLPTFFSAKATWTSFNRQMTAYQFERGFGNQETVQFRNVLFLRDQPELAAQIKSKYSKRKKPSESTTDTKPMVFDPTNFDPESLFLRFEHAVGSAAAPGSVAELQRSIAQLKIMNQNIVDLQHLMMKTMHDFVVSNRDNLIKMLVAKFKREGRSYDPAQGICPLMAQLTQSANCCAVPPEHYEQHPEFMQKHLYEMTRPLDQNEPHALITGQDRTKNEEWETNVPSLETATDYALRRHLEYVIESAPEMLAEIGQAKTIRNTEAPNRAVFLAVPPPGDQKTKAAVVPNVAAMFESPDPLMSFEDYLLDNTTTVLSNMVDQGGKKIFEMIRPDWEQTNDFGDFFGNGSDHESSSDGNSSESTVGDLSPLSVPNYGLPTSPLNDFDTTQAMFV